MAHSTLSAVTVTAISWVTGLPFASALWTASLICPCRPPFSANAAGPKPRTMKFPFPYAAQ
jgi:hypothetical protein